MMDLATFKFVIIPLALVAWWWARKGAPPWWLPAGVQLLLALLAESLAAWLLYHERPNHQVYNIYMALEFASLSWLVASIPKPDRSSIRIALVCALLFFAVYGVEWYRGSMSDDATLFHLALNAGGILLALQSVLALHRLVQSGPVDAMNNGAIWVLAATCLYFISASPLLGGVIHFSHSEPQIALALLDVNDVLFVLRYGLCLVSFIVLRRSAVRTA